MTPDLTTLARALVALPGWTWAPGMLTTAGSRVVGVDGQILLCWALDDLPFGAIKLAGTASLPDLLDRATGGVLLDRLGPGWTALRHLDDWWQVYEVPTYQGAVRYGSRLSLGESVARAMVARGRA